MNSSLRGGRRTATIRQRLSEVPPSRSDYRRRCDYPARNGQRLSCDYQATIQRLSQSESRTEFFPNFPKTFQKPDQNFFKTVRKSGRFFARQVRGCRGGAVSARGGLTVSEAAGSPQSGRDHVVGGGHAGRRGRAASVRSVAQAIRSSCAAGPAGLRTLWASWLRLSCC